MNNRKELRHKLFNRMSGDLKRQRPDLAGLVLCPLCMVRFDEAALENKSLTLEHIVPGSMGGRTQILTCRVCNNTDGCRMDSHLRKAMQTRDAFQGYGGITGTLPNSVGHVTMEFAVEPPKAMGDIAKFKMIVDGRRSNPAGVAQIKAMVTDSVPDVTLNFGFNLHAFRRAVIRSGYFSVFETSGYAYALTRGAEQVREVLKSTGVAPAVVLSARPHLATLEQDMSFSTQMEETRFVIAMIRVESTVRRHLAVFLPTEDGCEWAPLERIAAMPGLCIASPDTDQEFIEFGPPPIPFFDKLAGIAAI
jgi:hypothetical protein